MSLNHSNKKGMKYTPLAICNLECCEEMSSLLTLPVHCSRWLCTKVFLIRCSCGETSALITLTTPYKCFPCSVVQWISTWTLC